MKEVEVKVKIDSVEDIKADLEAKGFSFSEPVIQEDAIFSDEETAKRFDEFVSDTNFLRIRKTKGKVIFTLKRPQTNELDCIEREIEVNNEKQLEDIINYLGYQKVIEVKKKRRIAKKDDYELSLDEVEGLGNFLEVEHMVGMDMDSQKDQEDIWKFLSDLGVNKKDEVTRGYDTLTYLKNK